MDSKLKYNTGERSLGLLSKERHRLELSEFYKIYDWFLKRNLTEYIAIFLADFIGLLSLIMSPNPMLQLLPAGIKKPGKSH